MKINNSLEINRKLKTCVEIRQISDNGYKTDIIFLNPKEIKQVAKTLITLIK